MFRDQCRAKRGGGRETAKRWEKLPSRRTSSATLPHKDGWELCAYVHLHLTGEVPSEARRRERNSQTKGKTTVPSDFVRHPPSQGWVGTLRRRPPPPDGGGAERSEAEGEMNTGFVHELCLLTCAAKSLPLEEKVAPQGPDEVNTRKSGTLFADL